MFTSNTIEANGITQHYYRSGGDKPPLLLLHGFTDDGACWLPVTDTLVQDYDVILLDARGHGKSARIAGIGFTNALMAEDASALIAALGLHRPAVIGHSMGAFNALLLTATHPEQVGCLVLEDPLLAPPPTPELLAEHDAWFRQWANGVREMQQQSLDDLMASERRRSPRWNAAELQPWAESKHWLDITVFEDRTPRPQWQGLMQAVECPVLLLYGDDHTLVNDDIAKEAATLWKQGAASQIKNAGHCIRRDNPADFLAVVRAFLREHYA